MAEWRDTIDLESVLDPILSLPTDQQPVLLSSTTGAVLSVLEHFNRQSDLTVPLGILELFEVVETVDDFNNAMENLYEWADVERVWIKTF